MAPAKEASFLLKATLFVVGSFCYALLNVLSQLSKEADGAYAYSMPTVVLSAEFVKLCLSVSFLTVEKGSLDLAARSVLATPFTTWLLFAVPSVLYAVNNNLDMLNNLYMDPATESVLVQMKIPITGLFWWLVFKKSMVPRQWFSLVLLFLGCAGAGWPSGADGKQNSMYIEPFGFVLVTLYVCISASAGVYNEWLYKGIDKHESIHVSNIRIYTIGVVFTFATHMATQRSANPGNIFSGYNVYTWLLVATYSVMGLLLSQVMKFFDSIVKLFISGSSMYASAFLTVTIFKRVPSALFLCSILIVSAALVLYNLEKILPPRKSKE